jgi:hypothetical protein
MATAPAPPNWSEVSVHVRQLEATLRMHHDNGTVIESPTLAVEHLDLNDMRFADDKIYAPSTQSAPAYFSIEVAFMIRLVRLHICCCQRGLSCVAQKDNLEVGQRLLSLLYSYRSVSRAIPQVRMRCRFTVARCIACLRFA